MKMDCVLKSVSQELVRNAFVNIYMAQIMAHRDGKVHKVLVNMIEMRSSEFY